MIQEVKNREEHQQFFEQELNKLNPEQRSAVDLIEGPVLVIAGPGTGKTQILAARIGNILKETDASPENILCLTFTDAGSIAMKKRVEQFIGPEAHKVAISTFHSFCSKVIADNPDVFLDRGGEAISDLEKLEIMQELCDELPGEDPLFYQHDPYFPINSMSSLFDEIKRRGDSKEELIQRARTRLEELKDDPSMVYGRKTTDKETGEVFMKGDFSQKKYDEAAKRIHQFVRTVELLEKYNQKLKQRGRFDYTDLILHVIKAFKENENLLLSYQEQFQYILVDEFQDTNGAQYQLIKQLISYFDVPNVFVVGDDDQSIYRFQGAELDNLIDFTKKYKEQLQTIVLKRNYRSTQAILDASVEVIRDGDKRIISQAQFAHLSKDLKAEHPARKSSATKPRIVTCANAEQEKHFVAREIEKLHKNGEDLSKIAVLFTRHDLASDIKAFFKQKEIPFYHKRKENVLSFPHIKQLREILEYVDAAVNNKSNEDLLLYRILLYRVFKIPSELIIQVNRKYQDGKRGKTAEGNKGKALIDYLRDTMERNPGDLFGGNKGYEALNNALSKLDGWIKCSVEDTAQLLCERIISESGLLRDALESPSEEKTWKVQALRSFMDFMRSESDRRGESNLEDLLSTLDNMERAKITLDLEIISGTNKGVQLSTVHGSKGLEYKKVFLMSGVEKVWENSSGSGGFIKYPDALDKAEVKQNNLEDARRLFYVAITRAEEELVVSWAEQKGDKGQNNSMFVANLRDAGVDEEYHIANEDELMEFVAISMLFKEHQIEYTGLIDTELVDTHLAKLKLSVSSLNQYLDCSVGYYFTYILRAPKAKNKFMAYGTAVHDAMAEFFYEFKEKGTLPPYEYLQKRFEIQLWRQKGGFTEEQYQHELKKGRMHLARYYEGYSSKWVVNSLVEHPIHNVVLDKVPLTGKLDRIDFDRDFLDIVDYKTGKYESKKVKGPDDKDPKGSRYWRQAVFYKLLIDLQNAHPNWEARKVSYVFLDGNKVEVADVKVTEEHEEVVIQQIRESWESMHQYEFKNGCGSCDWCSFVKGHLDYVPVHSEDETEEEYD